MNFGVLEITLILLVVLLLFGSTQIPKLAKAIGNSLKEFKKAQKEAEDKLDEEDKKEEKKS
jgi:sec-independent protein translocase protein TatA